MRGAIFCHVIKIKPLNQSKPSMTPGNQKWNGAAPIFNSSVELVTVISGRLS
jgi:hypothetical protein